MVSRWSVIAGVLIVGAATPASAQSFAVQDPVLARIWALGMDSSQTYTLAQQLLDSVGPRLTGSPGMKAANDWAVAAYRKWGIDARNEQYGTWSNWRRGITHVDLIAPRVRTLEATMLAWSPGTRVPVEAPVVAFPNVRSADEYRSWLPAVKGAFVAISAPVASCRPDANWREFATEESFARMTQQRDSAGRAWTQRLQRAGVDGRFLADSLEKAGALGILTSRWSQGWGVNKIFGARTKQIPTLDLSCEDYGLVFRLAENQQGPRLHVEADAEFLGERPVFNTIATIPGTDDPDEYVLLSAHFDSWDGASGATDNGTGTVTMMEAMRILEAAYPRPRRTIVVGHWSGEEHGLNGSRAFAEDHPEIVRGLQALFNQDNGTGRVQNISMQGLTGAGAFFGRWFGQIPTELTSGISLAIPGTPGGGGSD